MISFNTDSNNITYQLTADNITEVKSGHIHIAPSVGANGSVSIPLYQSPYLNLPGATTTGLLAASALTPFSFVGPYLERLPNYENVAVSDVLSQFVQPGLAYAQVLRCGVRSPYFLAPCREDCKCLPPCLAVIYRSTAQEAFAIELANVKSTLQ